MPETPEQVLALLEAPHWKTPGSTSRKTEGRTARRTEGQAAVNLTVVDHIAAGRRVLAEAERIAAEGTTLALRQAEALREAQRIKSLALMGETTDVRRITCPYCGTYGLLLNKGRAVCINRHCAPAGVQRSWAIVDLMMARPVQPRGVRRSETRPRDDRDINTIVRFLKWTGRPMTADQVRRMAHLYNLPHWPSRLNPRQHAYSLSDVLTAHALESLKKNPSDCASSAAKPACSGLADAFFSENTMGKIKIGEAKALCEGCPFREPCLDTALADDSSQQHGVRGGLSANERRALKRKSSTPRDRSQCLHGHELTDENTISRSDGSRACRRCRAIDQQNYKRRQKSA